MKRDAIDALLQLAFLEATITTHGLYEQTVAKKKPVVGTSAASQAALQKKLEAALISREVTGEVPLTVGAYLRRNRAGQSLRAQDIFSRLGLSANVYRMLEQDRISPLRIHVESWKKLRQFFHLSTDALIEMIRRTHQLVWFRPSFRTTLARYDARKNKAMKASTLEKAARELYTKAALPLPPEEEKKLTSLFTAISEEQ